MARTLSPGPGSSLTEYLRSTRAELRKVVWPTREEAINLTIAVLAVMLTMAILLGLIDAVFSWIVTGVIDRLQAV